MSGVDVKSLFKSGKKTIKAFKIATGPETKTEAKPTEESIEHWEAPAVVQTAPVASVSLEEFKADEQDQLAKQSTTWTREESPTQPELAPTESKSSYVPPSQRRAEAAKTMPTLADAAFTVPKSATSKPAVAATTSTAAGGPPRIKLITAASKKAAEEEARIREEERLRKEAEKQARRDQLRAEMFKQEDECKQTVDEPTEKPDDSATIKAAPLDLIYAKYIGREKIGRKLSSAA